MKYKNPPRLHKITGSNSLACVNGSLAAAIADCDNGTGATTSLCNTGPASST